MLSPQARPPIPWATVPLLLPVAALATGIALAAGLDYGYRGIFLGAVVLGCLGGLALHLRPRLSPRIPALSSCFLLLGIGAFGGWYAGERHPPTMPDHLARVYRSGDLVAGEVLTLRSGEKRSTSEIYVTAVLHDSLPLPARGKLMAYLQGPEPRVGDRILLAAPVDTLAGPLNPAAFDYAAYLAGQNVFHRCFADSLEWAVTGTRAGFSLAALGERSRAAWFASLEPYLSGDELAVAAALIMGKRDLLGSEVKSAYADTGAIHVLAVSGLHVGILALLVMQILRLLLPPRPLWMALRTGVTILLVWYFALITGLSASVQRAALMVTVVLVGKQLHRSNNIFNLLAIAALVMLVVEPKQLFQVGFQLSFTAVAGIALFARPLQRLVYLPGKLHLAWDAVSVATAAQLGTLPLSLFYFGQFPVYFLLSGTLVIVFAYLVLGLGLLHGFLAAIGISGGGLWPTGTALRYVVEVQNAFIFYCRKLPGATLELTGFGIASVIGLFALIACLAYLAFRPSHRARWAVLVISTVLSGWWLLRPALAPPPAQFTIYHIPRASAIDVFDGRRGISLGDSLSPDQLAYNVAPLRDLLGVADSEELDFRKDTTLAAAAIGYPLLRLLDQRVLVLDGKDPLPASAELPEVDLILVRNGFRPDCLTGNLPDARIVVDGSNPPWVARSWKEIAPGAHLTAERGAYAYRLER